MKNCFETDMIRLIASVLLALLICIPCIGAAGEYGTGRGRPGKARQTRQSSAPEYCEVYADDSYERIYQVRWDAEGTELIITVDVELLPYGECGGDESIPCWHDSDVREYIKVWADWNQDGKFEGGESDSDCGIKGNECITAQSLSVSEHLGYYTPFGAERNKMTFEQTVEIPEGHVGQRQMRVTLGFDRSPDSPCGSLGWGDARDETFTVGDISITSPDRSERIPRPYVTVRGTLTGSAGTWNAVGVAVNGVPARVYDNGFVANYVPLEKDGWNGIVAVSTDINGNTTETSVSVYRVTSENMIWLTPDSESGTAPFETGLELGGTFEFAEEPVLTCTGPEDVIPEPAGSGPGTRKYRVSMGTEGIYYLTAEARDTSGETYTDTAATAVMNRAALDALLSGRWHEMREFLAQGEADMALRYFANRMKSPFGDLFAALPEDILNRMAQDMGDIRFFRMQAGSVEYDLRKIADGKVYSYHLMFVKDEDGLWKIRSF